jgi:hypothetical protein
MKYSLLALTLVLIGASLNVLAEEESPSESHGIAYPVDWQDWATIAVSHRTDNDTMRVILGNEIAARAARSGNTHPWPERAILGKVVWKTTELADWPAAKAPAEFVHAEFMFKDSERYAETGGWGWARWVGLEQEPFEGGMQVCVACHTPVKDRDWVFTDPAEMPD